MMIDTIALDLDGTLLDPEGRVPLKTGELIRRLKEDYRVFLISGRHFSEMEEAARILNLAERDMLISCDGMYIRRPGGEILHRFPGLRAEDLEKIKREMKPGAYTLCCITDEGPCTVDGSPLDYAKHRLMKSLRGGKGRLAYRQLPGGLGEIEKISVKREALEPERLRGEYNVHLNSGSWEILNSQTGKFQALSWLDRSGEIALSRMLYFGDSYNDLECMRRLKYSVAMGNAPQAVKEAAAYVTGSNREEGVYTFLRDSLDKLQSGREYISK